MTHAKESQKIGQRLAAARLRRGLAQRTVAARVGVAPSYLSRVENGHIQPTFRNVMRIVQTLGADLSEIVGPNSPPKRAAGPCPVTKKGQCLLDLIRAEADADHYTPRETRLLRRFGRWLKAARPDRVRAFELLLDDLTLAAESGDT